MHLKMCALNIDIHVCLYVFWSVCYVRTVGMTVLLLNIFSSLKQSLTSPNKAKVILEKELELR